MDEVIKQTLDKVNNKAIISIFNKVMKYKLVKECLTALKEFDAYTYNHCVRVCIYAIAVGKRYYMTNEELVSLGIAGIVHDIGKTNVGRDIICKPSKLTATEFAKAQMHVLYSCLWLEERGASKDIIRIVSEHHEKNDGTGYPLGITESRISLSGRILSVIDIHDALVVRRVYNKRSLSEKETFRVLNKSFGVDQDIVDVLREEINF